MQRDMNLSKKKGPFGAYDIRGIVGETLDEPFAYKLGVSYSRHLCPDGPGDIVVGRDSRLSSESLTAAFEAGIVDAGCRVIDIGVVSTPLLSWYGQLPTLAGSAMVTASHLPYHHNGFKLSAALGVPLSSENGLKDIEANMDAPFEKVPGGSLERRDVTPDYIAELLKFLSLSRPMKIAVDAGGGPVAREISLLCEKAPQLEVVRLGFSADPTFSERASNPLEPNALQRLSQAVRGQCAFGIAFDGDGDRAVFVDENGDMVAPDVIMTLLSGQLLAIHEGATILHDLRCCRSVTENIEAKGGIAKRTRVGHSFIKSEMQASDAIFAGELSGHFYYRDMGFVDNAVRTMIELLNCMSKIDDSLSQAAAKCRSYVGSGEINLHVDDSSHAIQMLDQAFADAEKDYLDGISVSYADWWFNARSSQTESVLRITVGAVDQGRLDVQVQRVLSAITGNVHQKV